MIARIEEKGNIYVSLDLSEKNTYTINKVREENFVKQLSKMVSQCIYIYRWHDLELTLFHCGPIIEFRI